jgi:hypothetical protein
MPFQKKITPLPHRELHSCYILATLVLLAGYIGDVHSFVNCGNLVEV